MGEKIPYLMRVDTLKSFFADMFVSLDVLDVFVDMFVCFDVLDVFVE